MAPVDPHSFTDSAHAFAFHIHLSFYFDFPSSTIHSSALLSLSSPHSGPLFLDTRSLNVLSVLDPQTRNPLPYSLSEPDPIKGRNLVVSLSNHSSVLVVYSITAASSALQWLSPPQTFNKALAFPFVYTQYQSIHARAVFPCQDIPTGRIRYSARMNVPCQLSAVMSARHVDRRPPVAGEGVALPCGDALWCEEGRMVEEFLMEQPIPPYLFAFAVGELNFRDVGPRTRVYSEAVPAVLEAAVSEFAWTEYMIRHGEQLFGDYEWERFDLLVLPPSFPYGGMETPRMVFLTPTVIKGDASGAQVVAHDRKSMDDATPLCVSHAGPVGGGSTRYDVYLSFERGFEAKSSLDFVRAILAARESSLDHKFLPDRLHANLAATGVSVKGRDESQAPGSSSRLPDPAAQQSKICIPIISNNYLSSKKCLRELAQMMERRRSGAQMVLPMFDGVDPKFVRHEIWNSVKARHSDIEGLQIALEGVGYLQGWKVTDWRQEKLVKEVVQTVQRCLGLVIMRSSRVVNYNIFLNFRGTDTRDGFVKELYTYLMDLGVSVFKDDTSICIGEDFRSELLNAITGSTIHIAVLSEEYGVSKWCRRELAKMLECSKKRGGSMLYPIFYGVEPYEVDPDQWEWHPGRFGRAIKSWENSFRGMVAPWEGDEALTGDANIRGWDHDDVRERPRGVRATWEGHEVFEEVSKFTGWLCPNDGSDRVIKGIAGILLYALRYLFRLDIPEHLLTLDDHGTRRSNLDKLRYVMVRNSGYDKLIL